MKIKSLLIGMLACTALVGCTSDDVIDNPNENPVLNGDKGYLKVRLINTSGTASRADNAFEVGTADENAVSKVDFFFYKSDGSFFGTADETELSWTNSTGNVEKVAEAVVVLKGLTNKEAPNSVLVLINASDNLKGKLNNQPLSNAAAVVEDAAQNGEQFLMTNSTFVPETTGEGDAQKAVNVLSTVETTTTHAATVITEEDFVLENSDEALEDANTVNIYVERRAAKVRVDISSTATGITNLADGTKAFSLGEFPVKQSIDDLTSTSKMQLYAKVQGWHLNATTKNTNLIKKIDTSWTFEDVTTTNNIDESFDWNDAANYRSYWGKSTNYDSSNAVYPAGFAKAVGIGGVVNKGTVEAPTDDDANGATLNYFNYNQLTNAMGDHEYCMENTNTVDILAGKAATDAADEVPAAFYSAVTQVVVGAQITDQLGNPITLVRYNRTLYTPATFKARVLNEINLDYYKAKTTDNQTTTYSSFDANDIVEKNIYDGKVTMVVANENEQWYTRRKATAEEIAGTVTGVTVSEGDYVYTAIAGDAPTPKSRLEAIKVEAEYYNDGMMHYVVPLKHLRAGDGIFENGAQKVQEVSIAEAEYGIVRNHVYDLKINSIKNLGTSVYDKDEDIIKQTVSENTYLIAAQLNILSWKIVGQSVNL